MRQAVHAWIALDLGQPLLYLAARKAKQNYLEMLPQV